MENENLTPKPFIRDTDYHRLLQVRSVEPAEEKKEEMILEGRAVVFNEEIELFSFVDFDGERVIVKESIDEHALDKTDFDGCFLKIKEFCITRTFYLRVNSIDVPCIFDCS